MDIYVLNSVYDRTEVVEEFESFIWTERYAVHGDFEIKAKPTSKLKTTLPVDALITHSETDLVMVVSSSLTETTDGSTYLTIKGSTMTTLLEKRVIKPDWKASGRISTLVVNLVKSICIDGTGVSANDVIPEFTAINTITDDPSVEVLSDFKPLYDAVKELCDSSDFGFRIYRRSFSPRLAFTVYKGEEKKDVVFSTELDTLNNPSELISNVEFYNIAYVRGKSSVKIVPALGTSINVQGINRRVLPVDATSIDPAAFTTAAYADLLTQKGREALAEYKQVRLFDGEIPEDVEFKYRTHYNLGDIVFFKGEGKLMTKVRITEYIWSIDNTGIRSYPSFVELGKE